MKAITCLLFCCAGVLLISNVHADVWPRIGKTTQRTGKFSGVAYWDAKPVWNAQPFGDRQNMQTTPCADESNFFYVSNWELDRRNVSDGSRVALYGGFNGDVLWVNPEMDDTRVYLARRNWGGSTYIYAFNKIAGVSDWVITNGFSDDSSVTGTVTISMLVNEGKLYVKFENKLINCYDTSDGSLEWSFPDPSAGWGGAPSGMVVDPNGDYLYYKSGDGWLTKLDINDGTFVTNIGQNPRIWHQGEKAPIIDEDGNLYVASNEGGVLPLMSFDREGGFRWSVPTFARGGWGYHNGITLNTDNSTVYVVTRNGLMAIDNINGTEKWFLTIGSDACDGGVIYNQDAGIVIMVALMNGKAHAVGIRDTGSSAKIQWSIPFGANNVGRFSQGYPIAFQDGKVLLCNINTAFQCIQPLVGKPENVSATDGTYSDKVVVTWSAAGGAVKYKVLRNSSGNTNDVMDVLSSSVTSSTYTDSTVAQGQVYYYWIQSADSGDIWGNFSTPDSGYSVNPTAPLGSLSAVSGAVGSGTALNPYSLSVIPVGESRTATLRLSITVANAAGLSLTHSSGSANFTIGPDILNSNIIAGSSDTFQISYTANGTPNADDIATFTIDDNNGMPAIVFYITATPIVMPIDALVHRWSFNSPESDTVAIESISGADGRYMRATNVFDGEVHLSGGTYDVAPFVNLPSNIFTGYTNVTYETWVTPNGGGWNPVCFFNNSANQSFSMSPGGGAMRVNNPYKEIRYTAAPLGQKSHFAVSICTNKAVKIYLNGQLIKEDVAFGVYTFNATPLNALFGGAVYWQHEGRFNGIIDEFRIYNTILNDEVIRMNAYFGPNAFYGVDSLVTGTVTEVRGAESGDGSPENPWNLGTAEIDDDILELDLRLTITGGNVTNLSIAKTGDDNNSFTTSPIEPDINDGGSEEFTITYTPTNPAGYYVSATYTIDDGPAGMIPAIFHVTARPIPEPVFSLMLFGLLSVYVSRRK